MTTPIIMAATLIAIIFSANYALERVHCPIQFKVANGALCKQYTTAGSNITFFDCSYGSTYENPVPWSPVEVCNE